MTNPSEIIQEPESLATVRFQDCDPFGHLNNARYIDYFLNARQDHLARHYDLRTYERDRPMRASWVIKKTQIAYLRPAQAMEEVLIRTRLIHFTENSLVMEGLMLNRAGGSLKAIIWIEFVYISLTNGRPVNHPDDLMQLCRSIAVGEAYSPDGFNGRVEIARRQLRRSSQMAETASRSDT